MTKHSQLHERPGGLVTVCQPREAVREDGGGRAVPSEPTQRERGHDLVAAEGIEFPVMQECNRRSYRAAGADRRLHRVTPLTGPTLGGVRQGLPQPAADLCAHRGLAEEAPKMQDQDAKV